MLKSDKKGLSEIIGYVLLIVLAVSLSTIVYVALKEKAKFPEEMGCPDGTQILIKSVNSWPDSSTSMPLNITIQNRGRFSVDGFLLRVNNKTGEKQGVYLIERNETKIYPGNVSNFVWAANKIIEAGKIGPVISGVNFVNIQPFIKDEKTSEIRYCSEISSKVKE